MWTLGSRRHVQRSVSFPNYAAGAAHKERVITLHTCPSAYCHQSSHEIFGSVNEDFDCCVAHHKRTKLAPPPSREWRGACMNNCIFARKEKCGLRGTSLESTRRLWDRGAATSCWREIKTALFAVSFCWFPETETFSDGRVGFCIIFIIS